MSAMFNSAGHPLRLDLQAPSRLAIAAALVVSIAAGGFAVGRATSDRPAVAVNGGSLSIGAVHPERGTIVYRRTGPAEASMVGNLGRHNHHPMAAPVRVFTPEQAAKDCQIHRHLSCGARLGGGRRAWLQRPGWARNSSRSSFVTTPLTPMITGPELAAAENAAQGIFPALNARLPTIGKCQQASLRRAACVPIIQKLGAAPANAGKYGQI
jgi:hypothetical protein